MTLQIRSSCCGCTGLLEKAQTLHKHHLSCKTAAIQGSLDHHGATWLASVKGGLYFHITQAAVMLVSTPSIALNEYSALSSPHRLPIKLTIKSELVSRILYISDIHITTSSNLSNSTNSSVSMQFVSCQSFRLHETSRALALGLQCKHASTN